MAVLLPNGADLGGGELLSFKVQSLTSDPTGSEARVYYNSTDKQLKYHNGTTWTALAAGSGYSDENAQDAVAAVIAAGTHTGVTVTYNDAAGTLSFAADNVPIANLADIATARILGRNTASTGEVEVLTGATVKTMLALVKADVGLGNVDNTADTAKPVSTAQQAALDLKANLASPTFTGTVGGITKAMVGLGNVDNTSDATKFTSPALTGTPTAPTATAGTNTTQVATTAFVQAAAAALVDAAPGTLDTLNELAAALGDDPAFATTVTNLVAAIDTRVDVLEADTHFADVGGGTAVVITHNLGTRDVGVDIWRNSTPWDTVLPDMERTSTNTVTFRFATAPAAAAFRCKISRR
ncbi:MAG TPA: hypothetical protein VHK88_20195 [Aquihabitans sp.]|jgi:hypothetical protein|nr:hypothetical protein [Aquihabitans sp.]